MESNNLESAEESVTEAMEGMENQSEATKGLMKGFLKRFSGMGREGAKFKNALQDMAYATRWSQDARDAYWNVKTETPKTNADYEKAERLLNRGIKLLDKVMTDFPTTVQTLFPLKRKLLIQLKDVGYLRNGIQKSWETLQAEVDESLKVNKT